MQHAPRPGFHFGFPYCHQGDVLDPEFGRDRSCSEFAPPLLKLGPHVAAVGVRFYTSSMFPPEYQNRIIMPQRGSCNRTQKLGFRLMQVELNPGQAPLYTYYQLLMFKLRQREAPQMSPFAADLSEADIQDIGDYYAAQPPVAPGVTGDPAKL